VTARSRLVSLPLPQRFHKHGVYMYGMMGSYNVLLEFERIT